ncbi:EF-hand calcium-binding domain-containing protein 4B isoform X2 [Brachyhypopomus gauderio]
MQKLLGELPLTAEDLENVFDTLDADGNGYLTVEEFSSGFSEFMFGPAACAAGLESAVEPVPEERLPETLYQSQRDEALVGGQDGEEEYFCTLMDNLGANSVFEDPVEVRSLWVQLRRDEPCLLANFEEFLARVTCQIKEAKQEKSEMESALKRKAATHDDEIQRLYEEMEQQINTEKDRILSQDSERFLTRSMALEQRLSGKERELESLLAKQKRLEQQCYELHTEQRDTAVENVKLRQYNEELSRDLEHTAQSLSFAQEHLRVLQEEASRLQEEREVEMYRVTEGLQRERSSLLKQLDLLREMNKHLRDERDVCSQKPKNSVKASAFWAQTTGQMAMKSLQSEDEEEGLTEPKKSSLAGEDRGLHRRHLQRVISIEEDHGLRRRHLQRVISIEEDHLPHLLQDEHHSQLRDWSEEDEELEQGSYPCTSTPIPPPPPPSESRNVHTPTSPRGQPVGKETAQAEEGTCAGPDRLFKVVLVGNSCVGKTSLLRRFCDGCFYPGTSATVGIDYSVKTLTVDNSHVALQMWDTAGQERYRSITKQFFRKADGVVVMYDITNEQTFTAVRSWLASVQEGAGEHIPIMLLGNKTDLEGQREVQLRAGDRVAKDSQMLFFECSALSGQCVTEAMVQLARVLKEQEDREKEKTVSLAHSPSKKKSCC